MQKLRQTSQSNPTARRRVFPISRVDLSERAGVSRAAITQAAKGCLRAAVLSDGDFDAGHPAVIGYIAKHRAPKHKPNWVSFQQFIDEHNLTVEQFAELLETLPPEAIGKAAQ